MPQLWRIEMYKRSRDGASPEQLETEFGLPAEEIERRLEAARLCFEKQCLLASILSFDDAAGKAAANAGRN